MGGGGSTLSVGETRPAPARAGAPRDAGRYYTLHMLGALFPICTGLAVYGWRAAAVLAIVVSSAAAGTFVWRRVGMRGAAMRWTHVLWLSVLLALMLPAHLASDRAPGPPLPFGSLWAILVGGGLLLAMLTWLLGGAGHPWVHPLLLTYLLLVIVYPEPLTPHLVLHRMRMVEGDVLNVGRTEATASREAAWLADRDRPEHDAIYVEKTAADSLSEYTRGKRSLERERVSLDGMVRDAMPPLEDLVVGGHPGPIGVSSAIGVIIGGLFLLYRSLIDYRIPLLIVAVAFVGFLILPVPVLISEAGAQYRPLVLPRATLNWATVVTFANYQVMAGPLLFMAFFMATAPTIAPTTGRGIVVYAVLVGLASAAAQLYVSAAVGPYIALLVADLLTPWLEER